MERDAAPVESASIEDVVPPASPASMRKLALVGLGLSAVAVLLGVVASAFAEAPWPLTTARLWLVVVGVVAAGYAVSRRPDLVEIWLIGAVAAGIGVAGVPAAWDSLRLLIGVVSGLAFVGAAIYSLPFVWRLRVVSAVIVFHFFGIFMATTSPPTTPWVTEQIFNRVYGPYLQFVYLRNAYHFYSPEPGPATLLCFLVKTKIGEKEVNGRMQGVYDRRWVVMPRHPEDIKDPLGVSFFRLLSLTEATAQATPVSQVSAIEGSEVFPRRLAFARYTDDEGREFPIPAHPFILTPLQFQLPLPHISRYILPSYARHVIFEYSPNDPEVMKNTTVMIYRMTHRTLSAQEFHQNVAPFAPAEYNPFYLGEYDVGGNLIDPQDPMLYWLVPVFKRNGELPTDPNPALYEDYLSRHAGLLFDWRSLR